MTKTITNRRGFLRAGAAGLALSVAAPAYLRAQAAPLKIGHLTPTTGFLGPLGEYAQMGIKLAVAHVNANGGAGGRQVELVMEDSVNPQTASTKAERMFERDQVDMIIGEISSASGLTISQVAARYGNGRREADDSTTALGGTIRWRARMRQRFPATRHRSNPGVAAHALNSSGT